MLYALSPLLVARYGKLILKVGLYIYCIAVVRPSSGMEVSLLYFIMPAYFLVDILGEIIHYQQSNRENAKSYR